ncbi:GNAT family N-acetyltransferase [Mangrovimicrobium sediminis]|uniref:GNAT family N-acetyltransferase n=1 Tax=Mangrovimicrobium sediminis TaxID=2562682 RepID=A0A4Z0MA06_9GAMM|nr:GNAT family N-acetyltransferase [Haliea sp. SAOS-164]TGD76236.1 GNAT family N-acetyltransferase [Haliea sp. SAOS-164]
MKTQIVTICDDLDHLVQQINCASWDDSNEVCEYDVESMKEYLQRQDTVFVACHDTEGTLLGIASSRIEIKPYGRELWLYVDEVDVCSDKRRKGAAKLIMQTLIGIARTRGCKELWLGAEVDNMPANALYHSLHPDQVASVVGYTYRMKDTDD